jgi:DNA-binding transcriptional MerR regulator
MPTIGELARRAGLSRSTLLYYDRIGLLKPSERSVSNYRRYSDADAERLDRIRRYREAGLPLKVIRDLVSTTPGPAVAALETRLGQINEEIGALRRQQAVVLRLLAGRVGRAGRRVMTKARWVEILEAAGLDEEGRRRWHIEFERQAPEAHQDFLLSLGLDRAEVRRIRKWAGTNQ